MGYQESLIKTNKATFNSLIKHLKNHEKELSLFIDIATIVTFKEDILTPYKVMFREGEKCVCITGDRSGHSNGFVFGNNLILSLTCHIVPIEVFCKFDKNKGHINDGTLDKIFKTHELATEKPFKDYIKENLKERER